MKKTVNMNELNLSVSSDWHNHPDSLKREVKHLIEDIPENFKFVGIGDLAEVILFGEESFASSRFTMDLIDSVAERDFYWVLGNHDYSINKNCMHLPQNFKFMKELWITQLNQEWNFSEKRPERFDFGYHFIHGHQYDWWKWIMWTFPIVETVYPKLGNWFNRASVPVSHLKCSLDPKEKEKYNLHIGKIHSEAMKFAEKNNVVNVVGHCHKPYFGRTWNKGCNFIDVGDYVDSFTNLIINNDTITFRILDNPIATIRLDN